MRLENSYSIHGLALAFQELDQTNHLTIDKVSGSGWDELLSVVEDLIKGMKCDYHIQDSPTSVTITITE